MSHRCNKLKITVQNWANEKKGNEKHNWKTGLWQRWGMSCLILLCCYASSVFLFAFQKLLKSTRGWGGTHCFLCEPEAAQSPQSERAQVSSALQTQPLTGARTHESCHASTYAYHLLIFNLGPSSSFWICAPPPFSSPKMCNLQDSVQTLPLRLIPCGDLFTFPLHYCWPFAFKWCWETAVYKLLARDWWYQACISVATNVFLLYFGLLLVLNVLINNLCHLT